MASAAIVLLAAAAVARAANTATARPVGEAVADRVLAREIVSAVNDLRARRGLATLKTSPALTASATQHSTSMGLRGYFSHESADGSAFWKRVARFYPSARFRSWSVGENLLWSAPDIDSAGAIRLWLTSPAHRAILLTPKWREIGLSAVHVTAAPGVYEGLDVAIVTADFGVRRP